MARKYCTRISAKHDTAENWSFVEDQFIPLNGEIIVYHDASVPFDNTGQISINAKGQRIKIGDGQTVLGQLDFVYAGLERAVLSHVRNEEIHVTPQEKYKISQSVVAYVRENSTTQTDDTHNLILSKDIIDEYEEH